MRKRDGSKGFYSFLSFSALATTRTKRAEKRSRARARPSSRVKIVGSTCGAERARVAAWSSRRGGGGGGPSRAVRTPCRGDHSAGVCRARRDGGRRRRPRRSAQTAAVPAGRPSRTTHTRTHVGDETLSPTPRRTTTAAATATVTVAYTARRPITHIDAQPPPPPPPSQRLFLPRLSRGDDGTTGGHTARRRRVFLVFPRDRETSESD